MEQAKIKATLSCCRRNYIEPFLPQSSGQAKLYLHLIEKKDKEREREKVSTL